MAVARAKNILSQKLTIGGYEDPLLDADFYPKKIVKQILKKKHSDNDSDDNIDPSLDPDRIRDEAIMRYRASAENYFIADNLALDFHKREGNVAFMTLGAGHELPERAFDREFTNPLPISTALALQNLNVVVVDTAQSFTPENFHKAMEILRNNRRRPPEYKWLIKM